LGHYKYVVVPFRLTNALDTFMTLMNSLFCQYLDEFVFVFIDDILIFSNIVEEHKDYLRKVFVILKANKPFAKMDKCKFLKSQIDYLSFDWGRSILGKR